MEISMKHSIKPCPFCGDNEQTLFRWSEEYPGIDEVDNGLSDWHVRCEFCGAFGPPANNKDGAIEGWNERNKPNDE